MKDLCQEALAAAVAAGAEHAEARGLEQREQWLHAKNGQPDLVSEPSEAGLSVRVLQRGCWGFAATGDLTVAGVAACARLAVANAAAAAPWRVVPVRLADEPAHRARYETPVAIDAEAVSLSTKLDLLVRATQALIAEPGVMVGEALMWFRHETQHFANTAGAVIDQVLHLAGCGLEATSTGAGGIQKRSYPNSWGQCIGGGYELIDECDLLAHAPAVAAECAALQQAEACPAGEYDLIIEPKQLALQIHESVGHPLELDRVMGGEANFAGTSFATTEHLGRLRYGSELVNLVADATLPRGLATFGFDDEGVAAQRWRLVEDGVLKSYFTSREYAPVIGEPRSRGCLRAQGWRHVPIIRMVNLSLEPGREPLTLEELIGDTKHGLLLSTNRSWSIDQRRVNFQFGCEAAWEIRDGRLGALLRDPVYHGLTTQFWGSCDAICDQREWQPVGLANCGKGQPCQMAEMTHGSSPARFRQVACGSS